MLRSYLVFLARPPIVVAVPLLAGAGLCGMYSLGLDSLVRQVAPEQLFARTMAISTAGLITLQGLGFALAGGMAQLVGPAWAIAGAGACGLVTVMVLRPRATDLRGLQGEAGLQVREGGIDALEHVRGGILLSGQHGRHDDADHRTGQVADRESSGVRPVRRATAAAITSIDLTNSSIARARIRAPTGSVFRWSRGTGPAPMGSARRRWSRRPRAPRRRG